MSTPSHTVLWFEDITRADVATAGGKGANLGELAGAGFPVPPGFRVRGDHAMEEGGVRDELRELAAAVDHARPAPEERAIGDRSRGWQGRRARPGRTSGPGAPRRGGPR